MDKNQTINIWLDRPVFNFWPQFTIYHLIVFFILAVTVLSRFIMLGERVMSHDEVNHVVPAYTFYQGGGYRYDPVTHGPLQFHLITLSYVLFGASDFSARIPDALFGIAVVAFALLAFKKYLGRLGSLVAGFLFMISPFISYYSRYTRNEIYIVFWGMALLWGVLSYLKHGRKQTLLFITIITALHFTDKATSYIFTAELLIFLAIIFTARVIAKPWQSRQARTIFLTMIGVTLLIGLVLFGTGYDALTHAPSATRDEGVGVMLNELPLSTRLLIGGLGLLLLIGLGLAAIFLLKGIGWHGVRDERSFDLLIMQGTIVLPLLAALPMDIFGFNPLDYSTEGLITSALFVIPLFIIALLIGMWWNKKVWAVNIGVFWSIFAIFYTTLFTQGSGFIRGLMGALGYWMAQQGVVRGTQPLYYYALVQIPLYEFLPAFGTLMAVVVSFPILKKSLKAYRDQLKQTTSPVEEATEMLIEEGINSEDAPTDLEPPLSQPAVESETTVSEAPVLPLLLYWSVMSLVAFSFAGERMPWLTTHIAMPMILTSGWSISRLIKSFDWHVFKRYQGWLVLITGILFLLTAFRTIGLLLSPMPPFQGNQMAQLEATSSFMLAFIGMVASGAGLYYLLRDWSYNQIGKFVLIVFIGILSLITIRTSFRANFILYDTAKEFLVYAHAARDPKDVLEQVEEISFRLTGGKNIIVAYDSDLLYPYWWYFRDYPNKRWFSGEPTRDLRDASIILVGSKNFGPIGPVVGDEYIRFDHMRLWWPSQTYYNLTFQRVWEAVTNHEKRGALWQIWFNRNYQPYAELKNINTLTLENWQPSDSFRMYLRKDIVGQIWEYGAAPVVFEPTIDPYEEKIFSLEADLIVFGNGQFQLNSPRDIDFGVDNTLYIADSANHRIIHLDENGNLIRTWGEYGASDFSANIQAPEGTFNEPWGVAVGPDGSVYVSDTWNHRIQKFTSDGQFITMWGRFGAAESNYHFWGPRGVAVDKQGRVFITDTGNKRVVIFDSNGNDLTAFGGAGFGVGQFDEPVGIEVDDLGRIFIADTWNKRIQIMLPVEGTLSYPSHISWDINGWFGDSLDNKPFLTVDRHYRVYVADPLIGRILVFDQEGTFLMAWGDFGSGPDEIGVAAGLAVDSEGRVWVSDARNNRLMRFDLTSLLEIDEDIINEFDTDQDLGD